MMNFSKFDTSIQRPYIRALQAFKKLMDVLYAMGKPVASAAEKVVAANKDAGSLVPLYFKLEEPLKKLLEKHYHFGCVKLDIKNQVSPEYQIHCVGGFDAETGQVASHLKSKYSLTDYGFSVAHQLNLNNELENRIEMGKQDVEGVSLLLNTKYSLASGQKAGVARLMLLGSTFTGHTDLGLESGLAYTVAAGLIRYNHFLFGGLTRVDLKSLQLTRHQISAIFNPPSLRICATLSNLNHFSFGLYKKVTDQVEKGVAVTWDEQHNIHVSFGLQQVLDRTSTIKAKITNTGFIGFAYIYEFWPKVKLSLSSQFELKHALTTGVHKLGLGLTFES